MKNRILFIVFSFFSVCLFAQNNIGVKFFGLSIHPELDKRNAVVMTNKLDKNGVFVLNFGGELMYEHFVYKDKYSIKMVQALYSDCASKFGGFAHLGFRGKIFKKGKHSLYGGIGPTFVFRRNWLENPKYIDQGLYKGGKGKKYQSFFLWYGGEFEYKYKINKKIDFAISLIPGYPDLISLSFGVSYNFQKNRND